MNEIMICFGVVLNLYAATTMAQDAEWAPVTGADALRTFMIGLNAERTPQNREHWRPV